MVPSEYRLPDPVQRDLEAEALLALGRLDRGDVGFRVLHKVAQLVELDEIVTLAAQFVGDNKLAVLPKPYTESDLARVCRSLGFDVVG